MERCIMFCIHKQSWPAEAVRVLTTRDCWMYQQWFPNCLSQIILRCLTHIIRVSMSSAHSGEQIENRHLQETTSSCQSPHAHKESFTISFMSMTLLYSTYFPPTCKSEYHASVSEYICWRPILRSGSGLQFEHTHIHSHTHHHSPL